MQFISFFLFTTLLGTSTAQFPPFSSLLGNDLFSSFGTPMATPTSTPTPNVINDFPFPSQFGDFSGFFGDTPSSGTPTPSDGLFGDGSFTGVPALNQFFDGGVGETFNQFVPNLQRTAPRDAVIVTGDIVLEDVDCDTGSSPAFTEAFRQEVGEKAGCPDGSCVNVVDVQCGSVTIVFEIVLSIPELETEIVVEPESVQEFVETIVVFAGVQTLLASLGIESTIEVRVRRVEIQDPLPPPPPALSPPPPVPYGTKGFIVDTSEDNMVNMFSYLDALVGDV